jgi:hypothetical protein
MPKQFYTEKDIEDLFNSGRRSLQVTDDVVLTELAYERAKRLGLELTSDQADTPPAAPVRPYLVDGNHAAHAKPTVTPAVPTISQPAHASTAFGQQTPSLRYPKGTMSAREEAIEQRIRSAVIAKLGNQVDAKLLDNIIHRVVKGIGLK